MCVCVCVCVCVYIYIYIYIYIYTYAHTHTHWWLSLLRAFAFCLFSYPRFYFIVIKNIISYTRSYFKAFVEPSPGLARIVMQMISLASEKYGAGVTSRWGLLHVPRFTHFRYTRRFVGKQPPSAPSTDHRLRDVWEQHSEETVGCKYYTMRSFIIALCAWYYVRDIKQDEMAKRVVREGEMKKGCNILVSGPVLRPTQPPI
jgi:hypothetical protein